MVVSGLRLLWKGLSVLSCLIQKETSLGKEETILLLVENLLGVSSPVYISGCRCIFQCTRQNSDARGWLKKRMLDRCKG